MIPLLGNSQLLLLTLLLLKDLCILILHINGFHCDISIHSSKMLGLCPLSLLLLPSLLLPWLFEIQNKLRSN